MRSNDVSTARENASGPRVLLTDTNRSPYSARLAIGFANAGCTVSAICQTHDHPLLYTHAVGQLFNYSPIRPLRALRAAIEATDPDILVPCDDRSAQHLRELLVLSRDDADGTGKLADLIQRSVGSRESCAIVGSRYDLLRIAAEQGVRIPDTRSVRTITDLQDWQRGRAFPWVLKADGTFGGRGVRIANDYEEAERFFLTMRRPHRTRRVIKRLILNRDPFWIMPWWGRVRPAIIVQSYIQGRPANSASFCWQGRVLAHISVEVVSSDGPTGPASIVRVIDNSEMRTAADCIANRLGLSGFFGLDFMIEQRTGATYLIEMNPRCTPLAHLQLGAEKDLISKCTVQLSGKHVAEIPPITLNKTIAYFPQAWTNKSEFFDASFKDIPSGEPMLVQELLRPWPKRSLLFRMAAKSAEYISSITTTKVADRELENE